MTEAFYKKILSDFGWAWIKVEFWGIANKSNLSAEQLKKRVSKFQHFYNTQIAPKNNFNPSALYSIPSEGGPRVVI
jgi:hypothetical protein